MARQKEGLSRRFVKRERTRRLHFPREAGILLSFSDLFPSRMERSSVFLRQSFEQVGGRVHGDCGCGLRCGTPSSVPRRGNQSQQLLRINLASRLNHHRVFEVIVPPAHRFYPLERKGCCGEECRVELSLDEENGARRGREGGGGCRRLETLVWKNDGHIGRCAVVNQFPLGNSAERNINSRG